MSIKAFQRTPNSLRLVARCATCYTSVVIKSFRHKGLQRYFESGNPRGIQANHANRLIQGTTLLQEMAAMQHVC